ncbi:enoyl-CoA delta isomerase 2 [Manduca sexta]|uniref:Enoyl-CoA delta isomerase 2, mitochondrial n=1 Tax=Manduca sexta TaxID=7130 RepID=A0A921ZCC9_MANSE|nr:enoyl-CoA delta isomerase 2 [Manduca sexta]KAG6455383.1 hypothetical protein O3G_MSEX009196 [Manduca sexta]
MDSGTIIEINQGAVKIIKYNKPARKNAIDADMYIRVKNILNEAAEDDNVSVIVLTGAGDFYSSGNDFSAALEKPSENNLRILSDYINAFITFPKILVAVVNGPAIGIAATTLALCDLVFAAENSYIYTPFTKLGIVAEGCSSYTFPRLIGDRKAAEMLMFNHKMTAKEALDCGFVNYLYKPEEIQSKVWDKITEVSKLSSTSLFATKNLIRGVIQSKLLNANKREMEELDKIWQAGGYLNTAQNVFTKKSKL